MWGRRWRAALLLLCLAAYQRGRVVMQLRERLRAFELWFNPKRRRWAGVTLITLGVVGMFLNPQSRWTLVLGTGIYWFFTALPPALGGKR